MYFTPKANIYYYLEKTILPYAVVISGETVEDSGLTLTLHDANIVFDSIESAHVAEVDIKIFGLYNGLNLQNITLSETLRTFMPLQVEKVDFSYSVIDPFYINAQAQGEFGEAQLEFDIVEERLHVVLLPSQKMLSGYQNTLQWMDKNESGEYVYDKNF